MFEVPGSDVKSVHIDEECVKGVSQPHYIHRSNENSNRDSTDPPQTTNSTSTTSDEEENTKVRVKQ